jgi:hypothetical protein
MNQKFKRKIISMKKLLTLFTCVFFMAIKTNGQNIDSLQLNDKKIPENYSLTKNKNCISIQACIFYDKPEMYEMLIGKVKTKRIQNFNNKKDKGSIMYFEFEEDFKGEGFLGGLLWGGDEPTKEHPEEYYVSGKFLIIWSFKKGSLITKTSKDNIKAILH